MRLALAALLLCLTACTTYRAPIVTVLGAEVSDRTEDGLELDLILELENPNREPLPLELFEYSVAVNGTTVYRGRRSPESTLGAGATRRFVLPAPVLSERAGWDASTPGGVFDVSVTGTVLYLTPGRLAELLLDTGVHRPTVGFSGSASVESR